MFLSLFFIVDDGGNGHAACRCGGVMMAMLFNIPLVVVEVNIILAHMHYFISLPFGVGRVPTTSPNHQFKANLKSVVQPNSTRSSHYNKGIHIVRHAAQNTSSPLLLLPPESSCSIVAKDLLSWT